MRHILIFLLCFVLAGLLLVANSGRADDAPIEITGGTASPIAFPHQSIRMDSEEATIRLHKKSYTVDAVFRFCRPWRDADGVGRLHNLKELSLSGNNDLHRSASGSAGSVRTRLGSCLGIGSSPFPRSISVMTNLRNLALSSTCL